MRSGTQQRTDAMDRGSLPKADPGRRRDHRARRGHVARRAAGPMTSAKEIEVRPVAKRDADAVIKSVHYSGKVVRNSQLSLGVFLHGRIEGAMQFGPSLDKSHMLNLVRDTRWNGFLELNRMAF